MINFYFDIFFLGLDVAVPHFGSVRKSPNSSVIHNASQQHTIFWVLIITTA